LILPVDGPYSSVVAAYKIRSEALGIAPLAPVTTTGQLFENIP
jgi:hypothetical protein